MRQSCDVMNWKYLGILIVVIVIILAGSLFMLTSQKTSPTQTKPQYFEENLSPIEIPKLATGVYREMISSISIKNTVEVSLNVTVGDAKYYAIEEIIPANWTITNPGSGTIDSSGNLKWVVLADAKDVILKYSVAAPSNPGKYLFSGKYAIGSKEELFVIGKTQIIVK